MPPRTPSQTVGPYFALGLVDRGETASTAIRLTGRVLDGAGEPVKDALIEIWHPEAGFGRRGTDADGGFEFAVVKPPRDGEEAPHLNMMVFARGLLKHLVTRVYFPNEQAANDRDPWLRSLSARDRATLVAVTDDDGLRFDVHLQGEWETAFLDV